MLRKGGIAMLSFIKVAGRRQFDGGYWKNAINFFLDELFKESSFVMVNPVLQFFPGKIFLTLNKRTWVYHLNFEPGENILDVPQPAQPSDVEVLFSGNQRLDVESSLRDFAEKNFIKKLVLILPPKKMILWKCRNGSLGMQVDDTTAEDLKIMYEDESFESDVK